MIRGFGEHVRITASRTCDGIRGSPDSFFGGGGVYIGRAGKTGSTTRQNIGRRGRKVDVETGDSIGGAVIPRGHAYGNAFGSGGCKEVIHGGKVGSGPVFFRGAPRNANHFERGRGIVDGGVNGVIKTLGRIGRKMDVNVAVGGDRSTNLYIQKILDIRCDSRFVGGPVDGNRIYLGLNDSKIFGPPIEGEIRGIETPAQRNNGDIHPGGGKGYGVELVNFCHGIGVEIGTNGGIGSVSMMRERFLVRIMTYIGRKCFFLMFRMIDHEDSMGRKRGDKCNRVLAHVLDIR